MHAVGGVGLSADAKLTLTLKHAFVRSRPSAIHGGFSFPSGHSTSVYCVMGVLFLVLIPMLHQVLQEQGTGGARAQNGDSNRVTTGPGWLAAAAQPERAVTLMVAGGVVTQSGRLLADAHWFSDVLAGSLLGTSGALCCLIAARALRGAYGASARKEL